jgi:hypothetical protein
LEPEKIARFIKSWDPAQKWSGDPYDLLDDKIKVFLNICYFNEIDPGQFHALLPRILTGRAEKYHLTYVSVDDTFAHGYNWHILVAVSGGR